LTEPEIDDLVAFMASLTSAQYREQSLKELTRVREIARTNRPQRDTARAFGPKPRGPRHPTPDYRTHGKPAELSPA
jgi:cytochrome c peroxidase